MNAPGINVLGIDLGTSQAKAMLCAPDGTVLGRGAAGYEIAVPRDGWAETDPAHWWRAVVAAVRTAAVGPVAAIAVTGQMHGVLLVSEQSVVLRPAILWLDRRATAQAAAYRGLSARSLAVLGNAPAPGMAGPLLAWLARHEPDAYAAARWQFQPKDWLRFRLTGEPATDPTDASGTLLYDLSRGAWAQDVVDGLGLDSRLLPPVRGCAERAGALLPEAAAELGLRPGIPVATGASDTAASLLAASLPGPEWALLTLGTGGQWIMPAGSAADGDPTGRTSLFRAADGGLFRLGGAQNVGAALNWVRGVLGASWDELYGCAANAAAAASRPPVFNPELVTERPRDEAAGAGGGWSGVTLAHTRDDLMSAALTGVAGLLRQRLDDLRAAGCVPEKVLLGGGGSRNPAWRDLLSDELGVPLYPATTPWLTARGATMIAAQITGND
ncbi:MAG TPA: FGGY family carbohydrate kinase [Streptosporangiaceae bacterium]